MPAKINPLLTSLVNGIKNLEYKLTTDEFLKSDDIIEDDTAKVDRSILAPLKFDSFEPAPQQSRVEPLLHALTLTKAQDLYDLERYETVGDSYLKFITTNVLYNRMTGGEGQLTLLRSALVSNKSLCKLAKSKRLGEFAVTKSNSDIKYLGYIFGSGQNPDDHSYDKNSEIRI